MVGAVPLGFVALLVSRTTSTSGGAFGTYASGAAH
jgi:hypothetical protein